MPPSNFKLKEPAELAETDCEGSAVEAKLQLILKEGANAPADDVAGALELPDFFDERKFKLGQKIFLDNVFAMMVAKLSGLLTLLYVPSILDILIFTRQSGTPCTAFRRYASTVLHTVVWYQKEPHEQTEFFRSLHNVRQKHCVVSKRSMEAGLGRITQLDMALTQFGFIGFSLLCSDKLGIKATEEEFDGLVHLWRVIGHLLGMEDRYNLCNGSLEECRELCKRLLDGVFVPFFAAKNKKSDEMSRIMLQGVWPINPHLDPDAFSTFTLMLAMSHSTNNNHSVNIDLESMGFYSKLMLNLQLSVHRYLIRPTYWWSTFFRAFFNVQMRIAIYLTEHFPFLAYYLFGRKNSQFNIYKYHYD